MKYSLICSIGLATLALANPLTYETRETPEEITDRLIFNTSMADFVKAREAKDPSTLNWDADGCSKSPDMPVGFDYKPSCNRHDFGYSNYKIQNRFNEENRKKLDDKFLEDLLEWCAKDAKGWFGNAVDSVKEFLGIGEDRNYNKAVCDSIAEGLYHKAVRIFGGIARAEPELELVEHEVEKVDEQE